MEQAAPQEVRRLDFRTLATPTAVPDGRRAVAGFAELHGVGIAPDVALAVSEAITNAVLHAYRDGDPGPLRVVACVEANRLVVVVRDYGCGMSPRADSPGLGLGLAVIGRLATELTIERPDDDEGGTRLRMCFVNA